MYMNSGGLPQAPSQGFDEVRQGMAAWSNDPQANFRYADGGFTQAGGMRYDGVNAVSFNDPDGVMDPPVSCTGTLAMGGFFRSTTQSRVVNGTTFMRILEGDVVFNDGWQGGGFYESFANFAEVATHELGHVLGLVDLGSAMQQTHKDAAHGNHCDVTSCLMFWSVNTSDFVANLLGGTIPTPDAKCAADLTANGGK